MRGEEEERLREGVVVVVGGGLERQRWPCAAENGGGVFVRRMNACTSPFVPVWVSKIMMKN